MPQCLLWLVQAELSVLGIHDENVNLKDVKKYFKKKSVQMLPEKHPTVPNAHTKFEEVNAAFIKVLNYFRDQGESTDHLLPGEAEVFVNNFQVTISLMPDSSSAWKKAIKMTYQNVIIGAQKATTNLNMKGTKGYVNSCLFECLICVAGLGVRHVVYWHLSADSASQALKVNLIVYDNDVLQV